MKSTTKTKVDPRILALCKQVTNKRPLIVIEHILNHGHVSTEELKSIYGYDHPPRAARDVRDEGIPLETFKVISPSTGRKIAAYRFGDPSEIRHGRIGGRRAFSKKFKKALVARYGEVDAISSQKVEERYLQIDHRIPYEVAGDAVHDESDLDAYMLLDAASQRAKSWSCEHCENFLTIHDQAICKTCYWASPERYSHIAMTEVRRIDIQWRGEESKDYDALVKRAQAENREVSEYIKEKLKP